MSTLNLAKAGYMRVEYHGSQIPARLVQVLGVDGTNPGQTMFLRVKSYHPDAEVMDKARISHIPINDRLEFVQLTENEVAELYERSKQLAEAVQAKQEQKQKELEEKLRAAKFGVPGPN